MLISETETLFRPSDCPGRENVGKVCKRHGDFHIDYYRRHCDANGNLVHIDVSASRRFGDDYLFHCTLGCVCQLSRRMRCYYSAYYGSRPL